MADSALLSELTFDNYVIDDFVFRANPNFDADANPDVSLAIQFTGNFAVSPEADRAWSNLGCTLFHEDFKDHSVPFYLRVNIRGHFTITQQHDIRDFETNCVSILLPYLRSVIMSFTAQTGLGPVNIPTINVLHLLAERGQEASGDLG